MSRRVLIAVTHLLGAGHLTRAAALGRAFAARGHAVTLASGGMPSRLLDLGGANLVQLPPVRTSGTDFRSLLDEAGRPVGAERLEARRDLLVATLEGIRPDVVVTELFPFGRRALASEFLALLDAAHAQTPRPLVACSVRDILVAPARPDRIAETHERLTRSYDLVLVHGDPDLLTLEDSWPAAEQIRPLLRYTGYVDEGAGAPESAARSGIVVSGGSSAASLPLYRAALAAAARLPDQPWRILVGGGVGEEAFAGLREAALPHVRVERARPDFRALLGHAAVSVSQAGYNTAVDLLRTGPAAVLVPFEGGHETEQRLRAERLAHRGLAAVVPEAELSGERLAEAVAQALHRPPPSHRIDLDGAARSVEIVDGALRSAPAVQRRLDWAPLDAALRRARDTGLKPRFWWRDDDAVADTPALRRLLALSDTYESPLALAVVPARAAPSLAALLASRSHGAALVHGLCHANHAGPDGKKAEFGPERPLVTLEEEARTALECARRACPAGLLPVFVPPWNRIASALAPRLPQLGYCGLSAFRDRDRPAVPGLVQVNTHLDPIDWHGTRSLREADALIAEAAAAVDRRRRGEADPGEPIGLLTHHLVHDEAVWSFCEALVQRLALLEAPFAAPHHLFSDDNGTGVGL